MLPLTQTEGAIRQRLATQLADVEARFCAELLSDLSCVNSLVGHVERYRGKMLRPTLLLVSGLACVDARQANGSLSDAHRVVATVLEMVHMATLVHDDVLDEADVRRHGETVNRLQGNETAVMLGDYLISHAYHLCSSLDQPKISRIIADATNTVCEGELLQLANRNNWELDEPTYFEIIRRKTASLCGTCCKLGAMLNDASQAVVDGLYDFGEKVGIAFQIIDDLLDLVGAEQTVGKTLGRDVQKGKMTLPLIYQLADLTADDRAALMDLLGRGAVEGNGDGGSESSGNGVDDDTTVETIRQLVSAGPAIERARRRAGLLIDQAKASLSVLDESEARTLLCDMADAVLTRRF